MENVDNRRMIALMAVFIVVVIALVAVFTLGGSANEEDGPMPAETAQKVRNAALAEVPGDVIEVNTEDDGWEVEILTDDGHTVEVNVDKDFNATREDDEDDDALPVRTTKRIEKRALSIYPGRVIESKLEDGVYTVRILARDGRKAKVTLNREFKVIERKIKGEKRTSKKAKKKKATSRKK